MSLVASVLEQTPLSAIMDALGDPIRLKIVRMLLENGEIGCGGFELDLPKSTRSHHFKVLRDAGIILKHEEGTKIFNYINEEALEERCPGLVNMIRRSAGPY
jgi:DNA-binding transcriptional ArsR family regulator